MKGDNRAPFTHGMEIEQFPSPLPDEVRAETMSNSVGHLRGWHRDGSGPRETSIGPNKNAKSILDTFYRDTVDRDVTWEWHSQHHGGGAGSHVHLGLREGVFEDDLTGWTVAYNTCVDLFPFLAPFFCHDWENGFRAGGGSSGQPEVVHWASPTTTRLSQDSVQSRVQTPRGFRRSYDAVTFNPEQVGEKPITVELRANDAHPAMALPGLLQLRRVCGRAIEAGWSPKLESRETLEQVYSKVYGRAFEVGLLTAMKEPLESGPIRFIEGRGIPGVDRREFETPFDVLRAIISAYPTTPGSWRRRANKLVAAGRDEFSPANNVEQLWMIDAPTEEFAWERGPDLGPTAGVEPMPDAECLVDLKYVSERRAAALAEEGIETLEDVAAAQVTDLKRADTVGENVARKIRAQVVAA